MTERKKGSSGRAWGVGAAAVLLALALFWVVPGDALRGQVGGPTGVGADMPEFTSTSPQLWVNSKPLKRADLRGKVVLLEIWTSI